MWTMKMSKATRIISLLFLVTALAKEVYPNATPTTATQISPQGRIANRVAEVTPVKVSKCCPKNQNLDVSSPSHPVCVDVETEASPFIRIQGLELNSKTSRTVDIQIVKDEEKPYNTPNCFSDFEVHRIEPHGRIYYYS